MRVNGGRAISFCWVDVHGKNFPITKWQVFLPQRGILPLSNKRMDAISPRRRLDPEFGQAKRWEPLANDLLMYRTEPT